MFEVNPGKDIIQWSVRCFTPKCWEFLVLYANYIVNTSLSQVKLKEKATGNAWP